LLLRKLQCKADYELACVSCEICSIFHPRLFAIAVAGASLYAVCTVASSFGVAFLVDSVILPRFEEGHIDAGVYLVGSAIVIGIGVLRAFGVVVRRSFAGISNWRTVESLTMLLVRQIMTQPSIWHKKRMTGDLVARVGVDSDAAAEVLGPLPFILHRLSYSYFLLAVGSSLSIFLLA